MTSLNAMAAALLLVAGGVVPGPAPARPAAAKKTTIKLATLVPDGSVWDKAFRKMGEEWKRRTDGRVRLRIFPNGVSGDEPDMVRKMGIGWLDAAALSVTGLAGIDPAFKLFEIPMFFRSEEEALFVLDDLAPTLRQRLADEGFVLLHWGHVGWIHLFTTKPVRAPDDLRRLKQFVWAGDSQAARWWKGNGFQPVPLAATDIPMGLETGLIEAVPAPPLSALAYQWFRSTPYMMDLGAVPYLGGTVITRKAWDRLSEEDRKSILEVCAETEAALAVAVPKQEREAIAEMSKRGLTVVEPAGAGAPWQALADRFAQQMQADEVVPKEIFERAQRLRREFRER